jgi:uncharacterized protein YbbK (DUF523 family)
MSEPLNPGKNPILVSACLLGARCTFDERINNNDRISALSRVSHTIALCPEEIAGLGTPRPASHLMADGPDIIQGQGQVVLENGDDVTDLFLKAAQTVLDICLENGVKEAYLKSKSPSCGYGPVKINREPAQGSGITAALLVANGIKVISVDSDPREEYQPPAINSFDV